MTETVETPEVDAQTPDVEGEVPEPAANKSREAAKYRTRLRETEAERDTLQAALQASRQSLLEKNLTDYATVEYFPENNVPSTPEGERKPVAATIRLKHASDFATFTDQSAETLLAEDGTLDMNKVHTSLVELWQSRPELFERAQSDSVIPTIGQTPGRSIPVGDTFTQAFTPKGRR